jgi:SAM-dependent methyltransferase
VEKDVTAEPRAMRDALAAGQMEPSVFRAALTEIPERERDGWVDAVFGIEELPIDGPELPRGGVPYLPSSVNTLLRMIDLARVGPDDVFVDVGSGIGRATVLAHLLTGADAIGIEVQSALARSARELATRLHAERVSVVEGDAAVLTGTVTSGTVFFLYCPFSGDRLERVLDSLESIARARAIRVCSLDLPLPPRSWLEPVSVALGLTVYRSV